MPSRLSTPRPPSLPSSIAISGETTPSIADASSGSSSRCGPSFQPMSTSCGSRVRRDGTIAMSSKPYACRAFFPIPISISTRYLPLKQKGPGALAARAEETCRSPSLKWTAIVAASLDDSASAEVPDAEDVRAVRDADVVVRHVAVRDDRQAVAADRERAERADVVGGVDDGRGRRRARHV